MLTIFISYRREDIVDITGRISDRLVQAFGKENVFIDVDSIPLGVDFREQLSNEVGNCDILLVVIGDRWLDEDYTSGPKAGLRRLEDEGDWEQHGNGALLRQLSRLCGLGGLLVYWFASTFGYSSWVL